MPAHAIRAPFARSVRLGRLDDARLAALAGTGDERAFEALYERHHRALLGFCRHLLGSREEGEDALQQTFLRAHRALVEHGPPDDVRPWLFAIARNRCRTIAASRRPTAVADDELEPATEGLGPEVQRRDDLRELLADLGRLPEDQRAALVLGELADLSHAEIGEVIGVPAAKVKALVFQARSRLIADREARETSCTDIRMQLATARGGELRRGPLRRHLNGCAPCRQYRDAVAEQRTSLALLLPVLPTAGLKAAVLGAAGGGGAGGGAAAAAGAGAGAASGGLFGGSAGLTGLGAKLALGATLVGGAGGGAVLVERSSAPERPAAVAAAAAARSAPAEAPAGAVTVAETFGGAREEHASERGLERSQFGQERAAERRAAARRRAAQRKAAKRAERREKLKKAKRLKAAKPAPPAYGRRARPAKPLTPGASRPAARPAPAPRAVAPASRPAPPKFPVVQPPKVLKPPPVVVPAAPVGPAKAFKPAKAPKTKLAP